MKNGVSLSRKPLKRRTDKLLFLQILLIAVGALAIAAGIWRDEVRTVFMKATYICLECIGIG
jgi:hypothetical protein